MQQTFNSVHLRNVTALASRKRTFCLFSIAPESQADAIEAVVSATDCQVASIEDLPPLNASFPNGLVIKDASWSAAAERGGLLYQFIVNLTQDKAPIWLFAKDSITAWKPSSLWIPQGKLIQGTNGNGFEYIDRGQVRAYQFFQEVKRLGPIFTSPDMLEFSEVDAPLSYIENILAEAMRQSSLRFQAGAKVGPFHVDFLVSVGDRRVVVECDGMTFHSGTERQRRDRERDSLVKELGLDTLRFTSHQIMRNPSLCALTISSFLNGTKPPLTERAPIDLNLDPSQMDAVVAEEGSVRVLAPAGAGKTKTLTNRICQLVNMGHAPNRILALAFNKKARTEMEERLNRLGMDQVNVLTFHALGRRICTRYLKIQWTPKALEKSVEGEVARQIFNLLSERITRLRPEKGINGALMGAYHQVKDTLSHPYEQLSGVVVKFSANHSSREDLPGPESSVWQEIFEDVLSFQIQRSLYTFSDMVYLAVRRLADDPAALEEVQSLWDTILVDEFQDLNPGQLHLVDLIASKHNSLMVVGDDDQMIYSWRGANVDFIRYFSQLFPGSDSKTLSTNYRCARRLVRHADYLIRHNILRIPKNIQAGPSSPDGDIELHVALTLNEEIETVIRFVKAQRERGLAWGEIGIISRYKQILEPLVQRLRTEEIPFTADAVRFFGTPAASAILSYLSAVQNWPEVKGKVWNELLKVPNKFVPFKFVETVVAANAPLDLLRTTEDLNSSAQREILKLLSQLADLSRACKGLSTLEILETLDATFCLTDHFQEQVEQSEDNDTADGGLVIEGLKYHAISRPDPQGFLDFCRAEALAETPSDSNREPSSEEQEDKVAVMSIHASKGKEWRAVVVFHGEDRSTGAASKKPRHLDLQQWKVEQQKKIEEERRVYYVAVTRPKISILLTAPASKIVGFFVEYLKNPGLSSFTDNTLAKELQARVVHLGRARDLRESLEEQLQSAERIADLELTRRLIAPHEAILAENLPIFERRRSALEVARGEQGFLARNNCWHDLERLSSIRSQIGLPVELDAEAQTVAKMLVRHAALCRALAARSLFDDLLRVGWSDRNLFDALQEALGLEIEDQGRTLRQKYDERDDLEMAVRRAEEDLERLEVDRSLIAKLQANFGIRPRGEAQIQSRLKKSQEQLIQVSRDIEDGQRALTKSIARTLDDAQIEVKRLEKQIRDGTQILETAVAKALDAWAVDTYKFETLIQDAELSKARIVAAQWQAAEDVDRLVQEIETVEQDIAALKESVYEAKFELTIRVELDKLNRVQAMEAGRQENGEPPNLDLLALSEPVHQNITEFFEEQHIPYDEMTPYALGESGQLEALSFLIEYLMSGRTNERRLAASAVGKLARIYRDECAEALPYLLDLVNDPSPQVRQYALKALAEFDVPDEALESLRTIAEGDEKYYNRDLAARIVGAVEKDQMEPHSRRRRRRTRRNGRSVKSE